MNRCTRHNTVLADQECFKCDGGIINIHHIGSGELDFRECETCNGKGFVKNVFCEICHDAGLDDDDENDDDGLDRIPDDLRRIKLPIRGRDE